MSSHGYPRVIELLPGVHAECVCSSCWLLSVAGIPYACGRRRLCGYKVQSAPEWVSRADAFSLTPLGGMIARWDRPNLGADLGRVGWAQLVSSTSDAQVLRSWRQDNKEQHACEAE